MTVTFGSAQANQIVTHDKEQLSKYGRIVHRNIFTHPIGGTAVPAPEPVTGTGVEPSPETAPTPEPVTSTAVFATCELCPKPARYVWQRGKVRLLCGRCFGNRLRVFMQMREGGGL